MRDALNLPLDGLRHYSISIYDSSYTISEACFKGTSYDIHKLATGTLTRMDSLLQYISWSNAIHAWGLGHNASSFKEDIKNLIELKWGTQTFPTPPATASPMGPPPRPDELREGSREDAVQGRSDLAQSPE